MDPLLAGFLASQESRSLRQTTITTQRRTLASFARHIAPRSLSEASMDDVESWLDACSLAPRSRYAYMSTLSTFYGWAVERGHVEKNPLAPLVRPRLPRLLPRPIGADDLAYAMRQADSLTKCWLALAALEGLRCCEISRLSREDVLDSNDPPLLVVADGKGGKQRVLPLHPDVARSLRVVGMPYTGPVFRRADGSTWTPSAVSLVIGRYLHGLGIDASAHQLRHYFGTMIYKASRDLRLTQELMGHSDPKTTAIYAAWSPADAVGIVNQLPPIYEE